MKALNGREGFSCLHTHTVFCDGKTDVETMCEAAFAKGFASLGFSSHAPIAKKTGITSVWHMKDEKLGEYIDTVLQAKKHWKEKLTIYLGLEVDYIEGHCSPADADIRALPLDYSIGSVHYLISPKTGEPFNVDEYPENFGNVLVEFGNDSRVLCETYYNTYNNMVRAGGCDILGHLDLIKKNNERYAFFDPQESWYKKCLVTTAGLIAATRTEAEKDGPTTGSGQAPVVEVNTGAMIRGYTTEPYPSVDMLTLLAERNIPLVLNADAHAPDHLGNKYREALQCMRQSGHSTMVFFEGRQNGKALWRERQTE
ncbi:MAG: histidinol-phosphatase [Treponema sp.]|nr:histidinol-phosphatase [Treponema sp.]